jgi:primosomal protein N' (replication factor Y)
MLRCHYCNHAQLQPSLCPYCSHSEFLKKGIGTQHITQTLQKLFPDARIGRADMDTTVNKRVWQETITAFENQELDILVGTQTITKGYDFPHVTLVGIIWADIDLNFPFYNAHETALQKIIQVAGRAGRHYNTSKVIVQTIGTHDIFSYINEEHYKEFYNQEIEQRKELCYPPFGRFAEITLKHTVQELVEKESMQIAHHLRLHNETITVLGPSDPAVAKVKKTFSKKNIY